MRIVCTFLALLGPLALAGCGGEPAPREAPDPPLRLEIDGEAPWPVAAPELAYFRHPDGGYDLAALLVARGIERFHAVHAGERVVRGGRFQTAQHPYRVHRTDEGFVLVGGHPVERIPFETLRVQRRAERTEAGEVAPCLLVVGAHQEPLTFASTAGLPAIEHGGRARMVALASLLARAGVTTAAGAWRLTDRKGKDATVEAEDLEGRQMILKINRRDRVHVFVLATDDVAGHQDATRHRDVARIEWVPR